tara:strand:+ start:157 stop:360 length:204 start_codon:yes stop_codon:yes gene_type:complete
MKYGGNVKNQDMTRVLNPKLTVDELVCGFQIKLIPEVLDSVVSQEECLINYNLLHPNYVQLYFLDNV